MTNLPVRPMPDDLEERYLELGLKGCAAHYRARHETVARWLEALGRDALRQRRLAMLREYRLAEQIMRERCDRTSQRRAAIRKAEARRRAVCSAEPMPDSDTIRAAAHYLRTPPGGRHMVCPSGYGDWFVGSVRVTPQDLVRRAKARGFEG